MKTWTELAIERMKFFDVLRAEASDATASKVPMVYDKLKEDGSLVKVGTRINWNGKLMRAAVDLWDIATNNPDNAPTLWEELMYRDGIRIIPEVITTTTAFAKDELGWWGGNVYKSLVNANVYTPEQYSFNWELVTSA